MPPPPPFGTHFVARLGDGVEGPDLLARLRVVGGDLAADAVLGAGDADVDLAVVGGRRHRLVGAGGRVFDLGGPEALAGLLADRLQLVVEGEDEELAVFGGDAAVDGDPVAADAGRLREVDFRRVGPVDVAGFAVDRHHLVGRGGDVDVFAEHQRERLHQVLVGAEPGAPGFAQFVDVAGVDFVLGGEAGVVAVAPEERPVFDFFGFGAGRDRARRRRAAAAGGEDDGRAQHGEAEQQDLQLARAAHLGRRLLRVAGEGELHRAEALGRDAGDELPRRSASCRRTCRSSGRGTSRP